MDILIEIDDEDNAGVVFDQEWVWQPRAMGLRVGGRGRDLARLADNTGGGILGE